MEVLILIVGGWLILVLSTSICAVCSNRRNARLHGTALSQMLSDVSDLDLRSIRKDIGSLKEQGVSALGVITTPEGTALNICPRCRSTLRATSRKQESYVSCSNPHCYHRIVPVAISEELSSLQVK